MFLSECLFSKISICNVYPLPVKALSVPILVEVLWLRAICSLLLLRVNFIPLPHSSWVEVGPFRGCRGKTWRTIALS